MGKLKYYIVGLILTLFIFFFYGLTGYVKGIGFVGTTRNLGRLVHFAGENLSTVIIGLFIGTFLFGYVLSQIFSKIKNKPNSN